jgi:hypothetical protein
VKHWEVLERRRKRWILARVILCILALGAFCYPFLLRAGAFSSDEELLREFYFPEEPCPECWIQDPLILNTRRLLPHILAGARDPTNPMRYALVDFLGSWQIPEGRSVLLRIVMNPCEDLAIRGYALLNLDKFDHDLALALVAAYRRERDTAPRYVDVEAILEHRNLRFPPVPRSYWQAFFFDF